MAKRTPLEVFKFGVYILLPIGTIAFFNKPEMIRKLIETREYIVYPPEGERPPMGSKAEVDNALKKLREDRLGEAQPAPDAPGSLVPDAAPRKKWFGIF